MIFVSFVSLIVCLSDGRIKHKLYMNFYRARHYASAVCAVVVCVSVHLSVCLPVTRQYCTKTAKHRTTQTTPYMYIR